MPRFYSPEWIAAFNEAVAGLDVAGVDTGASLAADSGSFTVLQLVRRPESGPEGELAVLLVVADGRLRLAAGAAGEAADVTVSLAYDDAVALSQGRLDPAEALGQGRIRVRGDLAVLVAGQALLAAAAGRLAPLQAATTY